MGGKPRIEARTFAAAWAIGGHDPIRSTVELNSRTRQYTGTTISVMDQDFDGKAKKGESAVDVALDLVYLILNSFESDDEWEITAAPISEAEMEHVPHEHVLAERAGAIRDVIEAPEYDEDEDDED